MRSAVYYFFFGGGGGTPGNATATGTGLTESGGSASAIGKGKATVTGIGLSESGGSVTAKGLGSILVTGTGLTESTGSVTAKGLGKILVTGTGLTVSGGDATASHGGAGNATATGFGLASSGGSVTASGAGSILVTGTGTVISGGIVTASALTLEQRVAQLEAEMAALDPITFANAVWAHILTNSTTADSMITSIISQVQTGLTAQGYTPTVAGRIDAAISTIPTTPLLADSYIAPDNAGIANTLAAAQAAESKTAALTYSGNAVVADVTKVTGITITGAGTEGDPWGP